MGRRAKDLNGQRFGNWTVTERSESAGKSALWKCVCDCGTEKNVESHKLTSGRSKSCGCKRAERIGKANTTHGKTNTKIYGVWHSVISRCLYGKKKDTSYKKYNITVCDEWKSFEAFYKWAINSGYKEGLQIDRIDTYKGYSPSNCRWVNLVTQNNNKRSNVFITIEGQTKTIAQWARQTGIKYETIRSRVKRGIEGSDLIKEVIK